MENRKSFEQVVRSRRSVRNFTDRRPDREAIERIVESAVYAPIASGAAPSEVRRLFVLRQGTPAAARFGGLVQSQIATAARRMGIMLTLAPFMKKKLGAFHGKLKAMAATGIPALGKAPVIIVIAEKRRFPPVGKQSMAHALQNMWLAATDEGLGFQLISAAGNMPGNGALIEMLGLAKGEWDLEACAVGYPAAEQTAHKKLNINDFTTWM